MPALDPREPFALLWDSAAGTARLFRHPRGRIETTAPEEGLRAMKAALAAGDWLAGGLSYEAGHRLEPRLGALANGPSWLRFDRYGPPAPLDAAALAALLAPFERPVALSAPVPRIDREAGVRRVEAVRGLL